MKKMILSIFVFIGTTAAYSQVVSFKVSSANGLVLPAQSASMYLPPGISATVNLNASLMSCYLKYTAAPFQRTIAKGTVAVKIDGNFTNSINNAATNEEIAQFLTDSLFPNFLYSPEKIQEFHDTLLGKLPNCKEASDYLSSKNIPLSCESLGKINKISIQNKYYSKSNIICISDRLLGYPDVSMYLENGPVVNTNYEL